MDPNLFHLDWERTLEALVGIVVLSFVIERGLALVFETRWWISIMEDPRVSRRKDAAATESESLKRFRSAPWKEIISFGVAFAVCRRWDFDAVSIMLLQPHTQFLGHVVTGAVIAGGSKASVRLFHDLMGIQSSASKERDRLRGQP